MGAGSVQTVAWADLVDDQAAIWAASIEASKAYRALVGSTPARDTLVIETTDGELGPLIAIIGAWAGGRRAAVDVGRARRLFWVHWLGAELFSASFPDEGPLLPTDFARGDARIALGAWHLARRASHAISPAANVSLRSPWPSDVTLLLLGSLGLFDLLPSLSAGGRVLCPDAPYSPR